MLLKMNFKANVPFLPVFHSVNVCAIFTKTFYYAILPMTFNHATFTCAILHTLERVVLCCGPTARFFRVSRLFGADFPIIGQCEHKNR